MPSTADLERENRLLRSELADALESLADEYSSGAQYRKEVNFAQAIRDGKPLALVNGDLQLLEDKNDV